MVSRLKREIRQRRPFASVEEEAFLNLQRTANLHSQALARFLKSFGITPTQYNALRILRGSHPEPLPCKEVGERMVTPLPDVTRLLDRLEKRGLVERRADESDRRVVLAGITPPGLERLGEIDEPLAAWLLDRMESFSVSELAELIRLMEKGRVRMG